MGLHLGEELSDVTRLLRFDHLKRPTHLQTVPPYRPPYLPTCLLPTRSINILYYLAIYLLTIHPSTDTDPACLRHPQLGNPFSRVVDEKVKDSRWGYMQIPKDKMTNPGLIETDIYGKLRSPWTTNDRS